MKDNTLRYGDERKEKMADDLISEYGEELARLVISDKGGVDHVRDAVNMFTNHYDGCFANTKKYIEEHEIEIPEGKSAEQVFDDLVERDAVKVFELSDGLHIFSY